MQTPQINQILSLASLQFGLFTAEQVEQFGVTRSMLQNAVARGWLRHERRGVFSVAGRPRSPWQPVYAAALAAGPPAMISCSSAAAINSIPLIAMTNIELTVPSPMYRKLDGVRFHQSRTLLPDDAQIRHGVSITTPVRTLIDLAPRFDEGFLGKVVDEGTISRLWTPERISSRSDLLPRGVPGLRKLERQLALRYHEGRPDSPLEQRILRVVKWVFPGYVTHHQEVLEGEVIDMDIAWIQERIDGEIDGLTTRASSRTKFERTSRRENILQAHGWRIVHLTHGMNDETLIAQLAPFFRR